MKLEVGMYVRTKNGNIRKIVELANPRCIDEPDYYVDKVLINIEQNPIEDTIYMEKWLFNEEIVKSSLNIIDLIEVGDYVNGTKVTSISGTRYDKNDLHCYCDYCQNEKTGKWLMIPAKDIKSIVTKEQFASIEYKVGGEDEKI